jgi:hypothetical protein
MFIFLQLEVITISFDTPLLIDVFDNVAYDDVIIYQEPLCEQL